MIELGTIVFGGFKLIKVAVNGVKKLPAGQNFQSYTAVEILRTEVLSTTRDTDLQYDYNNNKSCHTTLPESKIDTITTTMSQKYAIYYEASLDEINSFRDFDARCSIIREDCESASLFISNSEEYMSLIFLPVSIVFLSIY